MIALAVAMSRVLNNGREAAQPALAAARISTSADVAVPGIAVQVSSPSHRAIAVATTGWGE
jgi:hypothetical protein